MEQMSQKADPYTAGYDQGNRSDGNPPPYQPANQEVNPPLAHVNQAGAPNPYHAGYDQSTGPVMHPYPTQQQGILMQPQDTTINIQQQPAIMLAYPKGTDLTIPSIPVCLFCCCCTGNPAIVYAIRAQDTHASGRWEEAESYQKRGRNLMIFSIVIHFAIWIIMTILYFVFIRVAMDTTENALNDFAQSGMDTTTRFQL